MHCALPLRRRNQRAKDPIMETLRLHVMAFAAFMLVWVGLAHASSPMRLPVDPAPLAVIGSDDIAKARFSIEIARTGTEHSRGLMFRTDLPDDRGMLFVFPNERPRAFWMRNTPTPLDIVYADANGRIISIAANTVPFSTQPIPSDGPAQYVLELLAGTSQMLNIGVGDRLMHPAIADQSSD